MLHLHLYCKHPCPSLHIDFLFQPLVRRILTINKNRDQMLSYKEHMQRIWEGFFFQTTVLPAFICFQAQQTTYVA